ncbi:MAG: hypothetical protein ACFFCW_36835, partial [Candidatus Hodarchaeota archaeon]
MKARYLYIKNGDVVSQIEYLESLQGIIPDGGPNAFLATFLNFIGNKPALIMSVGNKNAEIKSKNIKAKSFNKLFPLGFVGKIFAHIYIFFFSLNPTILFKPNRIICGTTGALLWMSFLVSFAYNIPYIFSMHNRVITSKTSRIKKMLTIIDIYIIKQAKAIICHGPYLK